jgi:hypothetical protein
MKWVEEICRTGIIPATARFTIANAGKETAGNGDGMEGGEGGSTMVDITNGELPIHRFLFVIYDHRLILLISCVHNK